MLNNKERTMHASLEDVSHPTSAWVFFEPLMFEEQFKLKYGRYVGRLASVFAKPINKKYHAGTSTREPKDMDDVRITISLVQGKLLLNLWKMYNMS